MCLAVCIVVAVVEEEIVVAVDECFAVDEGVAEYVVVAEDVVTHAGGVPLLQAHV